MTGGLLRSVHHVGMAVADLDAAIELYHTLFGCEVELRRALPERQVEAACLHVGDNLIELVCPTSPDAQVARFLAQRGEGLHHVAYAVDDVAATLEVLRARGVRLIDERPRPGLHGVPVAFLHPSATLGVLTELVEAGAEHGDDETRRGG